MAVCAQAQPSNIRYWRITEMIPWTDAAALPASVRVLVQSGAAFLGHEVKGSPPLAGKEPVYGGDHPVSVGELFGGRVPEDWLKEAGCSVQKRRQPISRFTRSAASPPARAAGGYPLPGAAAVFAPGRAAADHSPAVRSPV